VDIQPNFEYGQRIFQLKYILGI